MPYSKHLQKLTASLFGLLLAQGTGIWSANSNTTINRSMDDTTITRDISTPTTVTRGQNTTIDRTIIKNTEVNRNNSNTTLDRSLGDTTVRR
ncbi:MAG TPA: hypothetical protein VGF75_06085 [Candidatus Saccharimonadales bacterium]